MSNFINSNLFNDGFETAKKEVAAEPVAAEATSTEKPWRRKGDGSSTEPITLSKEFTKTSGNFFD